MHAQEARGQFEDGQWCGRLESGDERSQPGSVGSPAVGAMKRTPEPLVVSVGLGVPTRLGDRRCGGGGRFEPELPEAAPLAVLKLTELPNVEASDRCNIRLHGGPNEIPSTLPDRRSGGGVPSARAGRCRQECGIEELSEHRVDSEARTSARAGVREEGGSHRLDFLRGGQAQRLHGRRAGVQGRAGHVVPERRRRRPHAGEGVGRRKHDRVRAGTYAEQHGLDRESERRSERRRSDDLGRAHGGARIGAPNRGRAES